MPSNISSGEGLWSSARDLSLRKQRKSRGAPMKERLSNFSSDSEDVAQVPKQEESVTKKPATSQLSQALAQHDTTTIDSGSSLDSKTPTSPPILPAKQKSTLFSRVRKVPFNKGTSVDMFNFEGEGLQFRGKLIGIKDVDGARGDEMCQQVMVELKNDLKLSKEHKPRINISVSLAGLKMKDDKGTIVMHQHAIPKISYIWRDQTDPRAFGYVYGTPESGHRFAAIKIADKTADALVGAIHQLFQVAFRLKQHEVELAKKGQDDTTSNGSGDSKKENSPTVTNNKRHTATNNKVDEANLLDLESELFSLSMGLEQMNSMHQSDSQMAEGQAAWADFGGGGADQSSSGSSEISTDPFGRGTPESQRIVTPDPFDTMVQFQTSIPIARPNSSSYGSAQSWGALPVAPQNSLASPMSMQSSFPAQGGFSTMSYQDFGSVNPFAALSSGGAFLAPAGDSGGIFGGGMSNVMTSPVPDNAFSVFDPPPVPQAREEKKPVVSDPFSTGPELFGDILKFGPPRAEKTSNASFPQPIKPKLGDLCGQPTVMVPSPTTVDPFFVTHSAMGLSVSISPPNASSMMDFYSSPAQQMAVRRVSTTSGGFGAGNVTPPILPPRPLAHSNSAHAGFTGALAPPPPAAPRRSTTTAPVFGVGGFTGVPQSSPFGFPTPAQSGLSRPNPFDDAFFSHQ